MKKYVALALVIVFCIVALPAIPATRAADDTVTPSPAPTSVPSITPTPGPSLTPTPAPGSKGQIIYREASNLVTINADGTKEQVITAAPGSVYLCPAIARDGKHLAVTGGTAGFELYSLTVSGAGQRTIVKKDNTNIDWPIVSPSWSPDGKQIAFVGQVSGHLTIVGTDGKVIHTLDKLTFMSADWSPDGSKFVAFARDASGRTGLYTMDAQGQSATLILALPDADWDASLDPLHFFTHDKVWPHWSADGKQIAFASSKDGNFDVYVANADGSNPHHVSSDPAPDYAPAWSPDGQFITFISERGGQMALYITQLSDSFTRRLTGLRAGGCPVWKQP